MEYNLFIGGIVLLIIEFLIPGFGFFGIAGLLCLTAGSFFLLGGGMQAFLIILGIYAVLAAVVAVCCFYLPTESKWNPFVLWDKQHNRDGYTGSGDYSSMLGKTAVTLTPLRPAGTASVDGTRIDVVSLGDYIDKDVAVRIIRVEGSRLFVQKV